MKNRRAWAARVNTQGLYSYEPIRIQYAKESGVWKDDTEKIVVKKLGTTLEDGRDIIFASTNVMDVKAWMQGVSAAMNLVGSWATHMTANASMVKHE